jgi:thiamine monophosphate kinase
MDITDGLGQSLAEIAALNNVSIEIDFDSLIIRPNIIRAAKLLNLDMHNVLGGIGIDLELVAVSWENPSSKDFYPIGCVVEGPGEVSFQGWGPVPGGGFEHFTMKPRDFLRLLHHDRNYTRVPRCTDLGDRTVLY